MRPTRPFITAYKNRSSKSRPSDTWTIKETENAKADSSLNDLSALAAVDLTPDAAYFAALKAADAVFGREVDERPRVPPQPATPPTGRILPNLLQEDVLSSRPASPAPKKTRRARQPAKVKAAVRAKPKKPKREALSAAPTPAVQPAREAEPEIVLATSSRARRSIQKRWVLKTDLRAGERWKRRLGKFAR